MVHLRGHGEFDADVYPIDVLDDVSGGPGSAFDGGTQKRNVLHNAHAGFFVVLGPQRYVEENIHITLGGEGLHDDGNVGKDVAAGIDKSPFGEGQGESVDLKKIIEPMVRGGKDGRLAAFGPTNHLLLTDTAENVRRLEQIIGELDKPGSASVLEVVPLQHASAQELAQQIN